MHERDGQGEGEESRRHPAHPSHPSEARVKTRSREPEKGQVHRGPDGLQVPLFEEEEVESEEDPQQDEPAGPTKSPRGGRSNLDPMIPCQRSLSRGVILFGRDSNARNLILNLYIF
jgi:hypothetical protein